MADRLNSLVNQEQEQQQQRQQERHQSSDSAEGEQDGSSSSMDNHMQSKNLFPLFCVSSMPYILLVNIKNFLVILVYELVF